MASFHRGRLIGYQFRAARPPGQRQSVIFNIHNLCALTTIYYVFRTIITIFSISAVSRLIVKHILRNNHFIRVCVRARAYNNRLERVIFIFNVLHAVYGNIRQKQKALGGHSCSTVITAGDRFVSSCIKNASVCDTTNCYNDEPVLNYTTTATKTRTVLYPRRAKREFSPTFIMSSRISYEDIVQNTFGRTRSLRAAGNFVCLFESCCDRHVVLDIVTVRT